jgi:hypothetical protein
LSFRASYCFSFFTFAFLFGTSTTSRVTFRSPAQAAA